MVPPKAAFHCKRDTNLPVRERWNSGLRRFVEEVGVGAVAFSRLLPAS